MGLREQTWIAMVHAGLSANSNTLAQVKQHAEHVVNAIEGSAGANYGDLDGNGATEDFGDLPVAPSPTPFRCPHAVHPCPSVDSG